MRWAVLILLLQGCAVADRPDYGCSGLWANPNPHMNRPPGALYQADEVVFRRPNVCSPRPGFDLVPSVAGEGTIENVAVLAWGLGYFLLRVDGDVEWVSTDASDAVFSSFTAGINSFRGQEARGTFYLTASDQIRRAEIDSATLTIGPAGLDPVLVFPDGQDASGWLANNDAVAYRVTVSRSYPGGIEVTNAPSPRVIVKNSSGAAVNPQLSIEFGVSGNVQAGDTVRIYRSLAVAFASATPSDELFLAREHEITAAEITIGYSPSVDDSVAEADLGEPLYTSPSREGSRRGNMRPPQATDVALYKGSLIASRLTYPHRLAITYDEGGDVSGAATGVGFRTVTGTITGGGAATITSVSDTTGLEEGQILITDVGDWDGTGVIRIIGIAGSTVTVNQTYTPSSPGAGSLIFVDSIRVDNGTEDQYYPAYSIWALASTMRGDAISAGTFRHDPSAYVWCTPLGDAVDMTDAAHNYGNRKSFVLENIDPDGVAFEVYATHGEEYEPPLPTPDLGAGEDSIQDTFDNGLIWTKEEEPEHWMASALKRLVGRADAVNLRAITAGDAVWILQGRGGGVYRLSGNDEFSGWRVDEQIRNRYLIHESLAVLHNNAVYFWSDEGPARISDAGYQPLGFPIASLTERVERMLDHTSSVRAFAVSNQKDDEVIFGLPDEAGIDSGETHVTDVYVYNVTHRTWSKWFSGLAAACGGAYHETTRQLLFPKDSAAATVYTMVERVYDPDDPDVINADEEYDVTITDVTSAQITITAGSGWTPAVGDLLRQGTDFAIVVSIDSATVFDVHDGSAFSAAAAVGYVAFTSVVEWLPRAGRGPHNVNRFQSFGVHFDDVRGVYDWSIRFAHPRDRTTRTSLDLQLDSYDRDTEAKLDRRVLVPRNYSLATQIIPSLSIRQADARWAVAGLSEKSLAVSSRVSR